MRRTAIGGVALALILGVNIAHATVGGPTICDVLGWDAAAKRVYVHVQSENAGDMFGTVGYFALGSAKPRELVREPWGRDREGSAADSVLLRRLGALRARLRPLLRVTASALPFSSRVLEADSLHGYMGDVPRFRVLASFEREDDFELTTYYTPYVARIAVLGIPGRRERLVMFSFTGDPDEGGYETQVPVLAVPGEAGTRDLDGPNRGD